MSKNLMIIDGAANCSFDVFSITEEHFKFIFPEEGQELECIEHLSKVHGEDGLIEAFKGLWDHCFMEKSETDGIHGTLFYQYPQRRALFPKLRWYEDDSPSDWDEQAPLGTDKNVMIDDGTDGCKYDFYRVTLEQFLLLFPDRKMYQEFEFSEDLVERHDEAFVAKLLEQIKARRYRNKAHVMGHHGTLYVNRRKAVKWSFPHKNYYRNNPNRYRWDEEDDKEWGVPDY